MRLPYHMNRRDFIKYGLGISGVFLSSSFWNPSEQLFAKVLPSSLPDLVAVKNGDPSTMFDQAIEALGGMKQFVKKGQSVVVKPNIGWDRNPETGANTNPILVQRIIEHCIQAGAKKVYIFDNTCHTWKNCYSTSGIETAAKTAGAIVVPAHDERYYQDVLIPNATTLKSTKVHELILESDVFINVPILKHHAGAGLTIAMKNLMGIVWDRSYYHNNGLQECISDFCLYRKPDLNIIDAYRVTMANGPQKARPEDVILKKNLIISKDIVAADAAAAKIFGVEPDSIAHIKMGYDKKIGNIKLSELNIKRITI